MRVTLLLTLVFLTSALFSQSTCAISFLNLNPTPTDPTFCSFELGVDFQHKGTSNKFYLFVDGVLEGTYAYQQLPVTTNQILNSSPNGTYDILIQDAVDSTCIASSTLQVPVCATVSCGINDLVVTPGPCVNDTIYTVSIQFNYTSPPDSTFSVYTGSGAFIGSFLLGQLPLTLPKFPWSGTNADVVQVCLDNTQACCASDTITPPACLDPDSCGFSFLDIQVDSCTSDSTYTVRVNFAPDAAVAAADSFVVLANGSLIGIFPTNALPLTIKDFPWGGKVFDAITLCVPDSNINALPCCRTVQLVAPDCLPFGPCMIMGAEITPDSCAGVGYYGVTVNFQATNPGLGTFTLYTSGLSLGTFPLSDAPVRLDSFPWSGNIQDVIRICVDTDTLQPFACCESFTFDAPDCILPDSCAISNLTVVPGNCVPGVFGYALSIDFQVSNPTSNTFQVLTANGISLGSFSLAQLPLLLPVVPSTGNPTEAITICIDSSLQCCATAVYTPPACPPISCSIDSLRVDVGACTSDSTYSITIDFSLSTNYPFAFGVWSINGFIDTFNVSQLPVTLPDFPWSGNSADIIEVCILPQNTGQLLCCASLTFAPPACIFPPPPVCQVTNLSVVTGACTSDSTYTVEVDFTVVNPGNAAQFTVFAAGQPIGTFSLSALPVLVDFPWSGGNTDALSVCLGPANAPPNCCASLTFAPPACIFPPPPVCQVTNLSVVTGACTSDSTYTVEVDFTVVNPGNAAQFTVFAAGQPIGTFSLSALPVLVDFPWSGGNTDALSVCLGPANAPPNCCASLTFAPPACIFPPPPVCQVTNLSVVTGACTSDSTYTVEIDFNWVYTGGPVTTFTVQANGLLLGNFPLSGLPVVIADVPWSGDSTDQITVCLGAANTGLVCCSTADFPVPDCLFPTPPPCRIDAFQVLATPCLCGQFFAVLTFEATNGGANGFTLSGNGNQYGIFPYNTQQPIILGPFDGDGVTPYIFEIADVDDPNCAASAALGLIKCTTVTDDPAEKDNNVVVVSPNPASSRISVQVQSASGASHGQADVELYNSAGRRVQRQTVPNSQSFAFDVSALPAGWYRLVLHTSGGLLEARFSKQ